MSGFIYGWIDRYINGWMDVSTDVSLGTWGCGGVYSSQVA